MSADLEIRAVTVRYARAAVAALASVDLRVDAGTCTAVLGPSGSGKTTLLRVVAGLETPDEGSVRIGGADISDLPPERRGVGMVFQRSLLFPHLSVLDNVAFAHRVRGISRERSRAVASTYLDMVRLADFGDRRVGELSGGQGQRVAIARALAAEPAVLLLDEPFSALDPALREDMHDLLASVRTALSPTILLVTHDRDEASRVADRIALIEHGRLLHEGSVDDAYRRPRNLRAFELMGGRTQILGEVRDGVHHSPVGSHRTREPLPDGPGVLVLRHEDVELRAVGAAPLASCISGTVAAIRVTGPRAEITVDVAGATVHVEASSAAAWHVGDLAELVVPEGAASVFPEPHPN